MIHPAALEGEEQLLYQRMLDLQQLAHTQYRPQFSFFLNPRQQKIALAALGSQGSLFGGFQGAVRQLVGVPAPYTELTPQDFPIQAVKITCLPHIQLAHRDVLGALMNMGITRESIGDILPQPGSCVVLSTPAVAAVLVEEVTHVGREGVQTDFHSLSGLHSVQEYLPVQGTVASLRLDAVVALFARLSRSDAAQLVSSGKVQHNYKEERQSFAEIQPEDVLSIRGHGKFIVDQIGSPTRKNRYPLVGRKYH